MIMTNAMENKLTGLGYPNDKIRKMTPQEAWEKIQKNIKYQKENQ